MFQEFMEHLEGDDKADLHHVKINYPEYVAFQYFLRERQLIIDEVMTNGKIDLEGLRSIANEFAENDPFCKRTGTVISDTQVHAFLKTMDLDGNLTLEQEEVVGILTKKKDIGSGALTIKGKKK